MGRIELPTSPLPRECSTTELHPQNPTPAALAATAFNLVEGEGFEPSKAEPTDLQSVPVDRLGIPPGEPEIIQTTLHPVNTPKCKKPAFGRLFYATNAITSGREPRRPA